MSLKRKNETFADAAKRISKKYTRADFDTAEKADLDKELSMLAQEQEQYKVDNNIGQNKQMGEGGPLNYFHNIDEGRPQYNQYDDGRYFFNDPVTGERVVSHEKPMVYDVLDNSHADYNTMPYSIGLPMNLGYNANDFSGSNNEAINENPLDYLYENGGGKTIKEEMADESGYTPYYESGYDHSDNDPGSFSRGEDPYYESGYYHSDADPGSFDKEEYLNSLKNNPTNSNVKNTTVNKSPELIKQQRHDVVNNIGVKTIGLPNVVLPNTKDIFKKNNAEFVKNYNSGNNQQDDWFSGLSSMDKDQIGSSLISGVGSMVGNYLLSRRTVNPFKPTHHSPALVTPQTVSYQNSRDIIGSNTNLNNRIARNSIQNMGGSVGQRMAAIGYQSAASQRGLNNVISKSYEDESNVNSRAKAIADSTNAQAENRGSIINNQRLQQYYRQLLYNNNEANQYLSAMFSVPQMMGRDINSVLNQRQMINSMGQHYGYDKNGRIILRS